MKGSTQVLLLWALSLGLAFFLGWQKGRKPFTNTAAEFTPQGAQAGSSSIQLRGTSRVRQSPMRAGSSNSRRLSVARTAVSNGVQQLDRGSLLGQMRQTNAITRLKAFAEALEGLDDSRLPMVLEAFESLPSGVLRFSELRMLMHAWSGFDPESALEYAAGLDGTERRIGQGSAIANWAMQDLDGAIEWSSERTDNDGDNPWMVGIIGGVVQQDIGKATDLLFDMPYGRNRGNALEIIISRAFSDGGTENLIDWTGELPAEKDPRLMRGVFGMVAHKLAEDNLETAKDWVELQESGEAKQRAVSSIMHRIVGKDPSGAAKWLEDLPAEDRYPVMPELVKRWAYKEPAEAGEWLNQFPPSEQMDRSVQAYVFGIRGKDPAAAKDWAASIESEELREHVLRELDKPVRESRRGEHHRHRD